MDWRVVAVVIGTLLSSGCDEAAADKELYWHCVRAHSETWAPYRMPPETINQHCRQLRKRPAPARKEAA